MSSFSDNLDVVDDSPIVVKAKMALLPTEEGGRHTPIKSYIRPNHNFGDPENNNFYIGSVELKENELFSPGETKEVMVKFLNVKGLKEILEVGVTWRIQEGPTLIGTAEVVEIKNET